MSVSRVRTRPVTESTVIDQIDTLVSGADRKLAASLASALLGRSRTGDVECHDSAEWAELVCRLLETMRVRRPNRPIIRIEKVEIGGDKVSLLQVITDDMPFLVDSVSMAVERRDAGIQVLEHPVVPVRRDASGTLLALGEEAGAEAERESILHFELDRLLDGQEQKQLAGELEKVLADVRAAVDDWQAMRGKLLEIVADFPNRRGPLDAGELAEGQEFLRWVADDHFTFLGYREYQVVERGDDEVLEAIDGSGLGVLRDLKRAVAPRSLTTLVAAQLPQSGSIDAIILTKANSRARVHRRGFLDYIGVLRFDDDGKPIAEQRFLGLFTSAAYMRRPQEVPLLREKVQAVMEESGLRSESHSGRTLRHILETLPRDELFQSTENELKSVALSIMDLRERVQPRVFIRRDKYGRFFSCLAYIPRDRYNTGVRQRVESALKRALHGESVESTLLLDESPLARLHLVIRPPVGELPEYNYKDLESRLAQIVRNWSDDLREQLIQRVGYERGDRLARRYARACPASYVEEVAPQVAAGDILIAEEIKQHGDIRLALYRPRHRRSRLRFKIFRQGVDIGLSAALPLLENLGLRVHTEHVYRLDVPGDYLFIQDFEVESMNELAFNIDRLHDNFESAFEAIWRGQAENDGFNRLVLGAGLGWRQVAVLRAYCKYLQQVGVTFSQSYMEQTLARYPLLAGLLVELFEARFDPDRECGGKTALARARKRMGQEIQALLPKAVAEACPDFEQRLLASRDASREQQMPKVVDAMEMLLDHVSSLDEDRIVRRFMDAILATLRTNAFQRDEAGAGPEYLSLKFDCQRVPDVPQPVPYREIFVCSPRVEGIHLRFGPVSRGGLRWSDRREDFRTEVLGLVKAQMVKNTVIVPVGSKGGFYVKRPPADADRDLQIQEGVACYSHFISGMLDITDNIVDGQMVPPDNVVRHDDDDPYLVVAADKGTASFSDIANRISEQYGYWLGDAFASGGSAGYDHKGMGITARGAWESVKRHFRAQGKNCQREEFTCVGIGDMSGDVFGNGMLLSDYILLIAAFDHRHIFIDPQPDREPALAERKRMFALGRSSWEDYDKSLISKGGGVYPRSAKSIPISDEVRSALGIAGGVEALTPTEMISAILRAPVELLWNGGIGTYVKASSESHADAGDRANNGLRINGDELRCKVIGEGGNLGMTQKGRIEAALDGVLLNTDFIDNSAGVDTSDHEVNIKILFGDALESGELTIEARNKSLAAMTDEVAELVLWDNYRQNQAITLMERLSQHRMGSKRHFIRILEAEGFLNRAIESLPDDDELADRQARGIGLTRPELAVLLSYSKLKLYQQLLDSDVPEDAYLSRELARYFPEPLREPYADAMLGHRLRREIIATAVTNSVVNRMGATFVLRMQEDTGQSPTAVAKAFNAAREILEVRDLWAAIEELDGEVVEATQIDAILKIWALLRSITRWLLNRPGVVLDIAELVSRYQPGVSELTAVLPDVLTPTGKGAFGADSEKWQGLGCPELLAQRLARIPVLGSALDVVEVAKESGRPVEYVAKLFFELGEALDLEWLRLRIEELPVASRWHAQARGSLRDELNAQQRALAVSLLADKPAADGASPVAAWLANDDKTLRYTLDVLEEISAQPLDYPLASVAVRRLAQLAQSRGER